VCRFIGTEQKVPDVRFTSVSRIVDCHMEVASYYPSGAWHLKVAPG
jgi:hypothetical protein